MTTAETDEPKAAGQRLQFACLTPNSREYFTQFLLFPGDNARGPWGREGMFTLGARIFMGGKEVATVAKQECSEIEHLTLDFETAITETGRDVDGFAVVTMETNSDIPVDIYLSHIHRETGVYFAYPALPFMGDVLYPQAHLHQMENTMFWPGMAGGKTTEFRLAIINPYDVPMGVEVVVWGNRRVRHACGVHRVGAHDILWLSMDRLLPAEWIADPDDSCSVCVSAQFKVIAYMTLVNRQHSVMTSADHLHPYFLH